MSIPLCCSDRICGTPTYTFKNHAIAERPHNKCSRKCRRVAAAKILQCLYSSDSHQLVFISPFHPHKEAIPCGLI
jgi:hypothetical protein